jgi:REP element-mobilizing transposase RayT
MLTPGKGYGALRHGRRSAPNADYFLTLCLRRPSCGLLGGDLTGRCLEEMRRLEQDGRWEVRCAVVMPDHLHLLVTLVADTELSAAVRLFKGRLVPNLRSYGVGWQPSFYDHRLRPDDDRLPVFLYIFLNPYRAKLLPADQTWPGYYCATTDWTWFGDLTRESCPEPEWLR